jgi:hypothetical protein
VFRIQQRGERQHTTCQPLPAIPSPALALSSAPPHPRLTSPARHKPSPPPCRARPHAEPTSPAHEPSRPRARPGAKPDGPSPTAKPGPALVPTCCTCEHGLHRCRVRGGNLPLRAVATRLSGTRPLPSPAPPPTSRAQAWAGTKQRRCGPHPRHPAACNVPGASGNISRLGPDLQCGTGRPGRRAWRGTAGRGAAGRGAAGGKDGAAVHGVRQGGAWGGGMRRGAGRGARGAGRGA